MCTRQQEASLRATLPTVSSSSAQSSSMAAVLALNSGVLVCTPDGSTLKLFSATVLTPRRPRLTGKAGELLVVGGVGW